MLQVNHAPQERREPEALCAPTVVKKRGEEDDDEQEYIKHANYRVHIRQILAAEDRVRYWQQPN